MRERYAVVILLGDGRNRSRDASSMLAVDLERAGEAVEVHEDVALQLLLADAVRLLVERAPARGIVDVAAAAVTTEDIGLLLGGRAAGDLRQVDAVLEVAAILVHDAE